MTANTQIPEEKCLDNTCKLLMEGYLFMPNRFRKYNSDLFVTRLMGQKVICMRGEDAAEIFYDNQLFTRKGAVPKRIQKTLFGVKAIQTMDGAAHRHRKSFFMSLMTPESIDRLVAITKSRLKKNSKKWAVKGSIVLFDEMSILFCQAACQWSGVPLRQSETSQRAKDLSAMVDAFGAVGPRYWCGRCARIRTECWMKKIIGEVRRGRLSVPSDSVLHRIAFYREPNGSLLNLKLAGIEMINILRPITAIATYVTFGALALHQNPVCKKKLREGEKNYSHMFAQEVRRYFPFGPFLGARVKEDFIYMKHYFRKGTLVFLDLYGTDHDSRIWNNPTEFIPERFALRNGTPFDFIPQGGGDASKGHRCPGEWITVELIKAAMEYLSGHLEYEVPLQDFGYSLRRMPTLPKSGFLISRVKPV